MQGRGWHVGWSELCCGLEVWHEGGGGERKMKSPIASAVDMEKERIMIGREMMSVRGLRACDEMGVLRGVPTLRCADNELCACLVCWRSARSWAPCWRFSWTSSPAWKTWVHLPLYPPCQNATCCSFTADSTQSTVCCVRVRAKGCVCVCVCESCLPQYARCSWWGSGLPHVYKHNYAGI